MSKRQFEGDFQISNTAERSNNIVIVRTVAFPAKKLKLGASEAPFQPPLPPERQNVELNDIPVPPPPLQTPKPTDKDQKCSDDKIVIKNEELTKNPMEKTVETTPAKNAKDVSGQKYSVSEEKISVSETKSEEIQSKTSLNKSGASNYLKSIGQTYMKPIKINLSLQKKNSTSVKEILERNEDNNDATKPDEKDKYVLKNKEVIMDKPPAPYKPETPNKTYTEIYTVKKTPLNTNSQHVSYTHLSTPSPAGQFIIPNANRTLSNTDHFPYETVPLPPPLHLPQEYYYCNPNNNMSPALHTPAVDYAPHLHHNISYDPYEAHLNNFMLDRPLHENYRMNTHPPTPPYITDRNASDRSYLEKIDKFLAKVSKDAPYDRSDRERSHLRSLSLRRRVSDESLTPRREIYRDYHRSQIKYESNPRDRDEIKPRRYGVIEKCSKSKEKQNIHKFVSKDHKTPEQFKGEINKKSKSLGERNSIEESDTDNNSSSDDSTQHNKNLKVGSKSFLEKTRDENKSEINTNKNDEKESNNHEINSHKNEENEKHIKENNKFQEGIRKQILPAYENIKEEECYKINKHSGNCENKVEIDRKEQPRRSNSSDKVIAPHNPRKSDEKVQNDPAKKLRILGSECYEEDNFNILSRKYNESRTKVSKGLCSLLKSEKISGCRRSEELEYNEPKKKIDENPKRRASEFTEDDDIKCCNKSPRENKKQQTFSLNKRDTASHSPRRHDDKAHIKSTIKRAMLASPEYTEDEGKYSREQSHPKSEKNSGSHNSRKSEENEQNGSSRKHETESSSEKELNHNKYNKNYDMCKNITEIDRKKRCLSNSEVDGARHSSRTPEGTKHITSRRKQDNKEKSSSKKKPKKTIKDIIAQKIKKYTEELKKLSRYELSGKSHENKPEKTRSETPGTSKNLKDSDYTKRLSTPLKSPIKFKDDSEFYTTDEHFDLRSKLSRPNLNQCINKFGAENSIISETIRENHENLVLTVANDEASQNKEPVTYPENTTRKAKNKKVKKIQLVINVLCEESDSSETEEKSADKITKKSSSLNAEDLSFLDDLNIDEIVNSLKSNQNEFNVTKTTAGNSTNIEEYVISDDDSDASTVHLEEVEYTHKVDDDEQPDVTKTEFDEKDDKNLIRDLVKNNLLFAEQRFQQKTDLKGTETMGNEIGNNVELISPNKIKQETDDKKNLSPLNKCPNKSENFSLQTAKSIEVDEKEFFKRLFTPMVEIKEEPIEILSDDEATANNNLDISEFIDKKLDTTLKTAKLIDKKISGHQNATTETYNSLSPAIKVKMAPVNSDVASSKSMFPNKSACLINNNYTIKSEPMETEHNTGVVREGIPIIGLSEQNCIYIPNNVNDEAEIKKAPEERADVSMDSHGHTQNNISVAAEATNSTYINNTPKNNAQEHEIKTKPEKKKNGEDVSSSKLKSPEEKRTTQNDENKNKTTYNNEEKSKSDCNFVHAAPDMITSEATPDIVILTNEHNTENNETVNTKQQTDEIGPVAPCEKEYNENKSAAKWSDDNAVNVKTLVEQLESMFKETDVKKAKTKDDTVQLTASGTHTKELEATTTKNTGSVINVESKLASHSEKPLHQDKEVEKETTTQKVSPNISENEPKVSDKIKETSNAEKPPVKNNQSYSKANHNESQSNSSSNKTGNKSRCHSPITAPSPLNVALSSKTAKPALLPTPKRLKTVKTPLNSPSLPKSVSTSNSNTSSPNNSKAAKEARKSSPAIKCSSPANGSKPSLPSTPKSQPNSSTTDVPLQKTSLSAISKVANTYGGVTLRPNEQTLVQNLKTRMDEYLKESCDVTALLHRGKFSKIFKCRDAKGNDGVVKIINVNCDRYTTGVLKEKMLIKLQSEIPEKNLNVIRVLDGFSANGQWCILMEYYPKNLSQALEESEKPFHIDQVQHLSRQLATAVTSLRNHNIVHSDIKPGHVLLNATNDRLKLCGFDDAYYGECKPVPNIGTVNYRAPEIILGYSTSFSIDVWSTALVMFEMASKRQLFPGSNNNDILFKQMCTVGLMPPDMIQLSRFGHKHFDEALMFMRRMGDKGQDIIYHNPDKIYKNNILQGTIRGVHKQHWYSNSTKQQWQQDLTKINQFCTLLEQMLVMHPTQRLSIEC